MLDSKTAKGRLTLQQKGISGSKMKVIWEFKGILTRLKKGTYKHLETRKIKRSSP